MSGTNIHFESYDSSTEDWTSYVERVESYFKVNGVAEAKQGSALLSVMGASTYKLLKTLATPKAPSELKFQEMVDLLKEHLSPKPLEMTERYRFYKRLQREGMVDSPSKCGSDSDCSDPALHTCDPELKVCKCREPSSMLSHSTGACLPAKQLGEKCKEEGQCRLMEQNATCLNSSCVCDSGFYQKNDSINGTTCIVEKGGAETAARGVDQHMIVVLVALAVMFIGICVALHLYSKARGWTRRSIFNNPASRLLNVKLGKRRKSSVCAKHMPLPPPWGGTLLPRHNSFAGHHSPFLDHTDPKTRSHECLQSALIHPEFPPKFEIQPPKKSPLAMNEDLDKKLSKYLATCLPENPVAPEISSRHPSLQTTGLN